MDEIDPHPTQPDSKPPMHRESLEAPKLWQRQRFGFLACAVGLASLVTATILQMVKDELFSAGPDIRITMPFWIAAVVLAIASMMQREKAWSLAIGGVALATASLALGYVLALALVAVLAILVIAILSHLF